MFDVKPSRYEPNLLEFNVKSAVFDERSLMSEINLFMVDVKPSMFEVK